MGFLLSKLFSALVLPPGINILTGFAGLFLHRRAPRLGIALLMISVFSLYLLSTPIVSRLLIRSLEVHEVAEPASLKENVDAIVVLGGGVYRGGEYGADTVSPLTLSRIRYAAYLHRMTDIPLLVSGGIARHGPAEGMLMADVLRNEFRIPVRWVEKKSRNTQENAVFSTALLSQAGIERIAVVTHASHMPRAVAAFARQGVDVVTAPIEFSSRDEIKWASVLLPRLFSLSLSSIALHEYLGMVWYWLRY